MHFVGVLQFDTEYVRHRSQKIIEWINEYPYGPEEEEGVVYLDGASRDWCMVVEGNATDNMKIRFLKKSPEATLIATNCFKALPFSLPEDYDEKYDPLGYYVYNSLEADFCKPVVENHWDTFLKTAFGPSTMQVIQYIPQEKRLIWSVRTSVEQEPGDLSRIMCRNLETLFAMPDPLPFVAPVP
jgi:superfamily I DNA and/or RNA helicase